MGIDNPRKTTLRGLVIDKKGRILVCYYRRYRTYMSPGGHLDDGETFLEALKREMWEEVGATEVKVLEHIIDLYTVPNDTLSKYYLIEIDKVDTKNRELEPGEIKDGLTLRWATIQDIVEHNNIEYYRALKNEEGKPYMIKRELEFFKEVWEKYFD